MIFHTDIHIHVPYFPGMLYTISVCFERAFVVTICHKVDLHIQNVDILDVTILCRYTVGPTSRRW